MPVRATPRPKPPRDVREQIVRAAQHIIEERGLAGATTRAIAEQARCAEGSIYRYFPDKHALFVECVKERFPEFIEMMTSLPETAGAGSVRDHLEAVARAALVFYRAILPMVAGAMAERELLEQQRRHYTRAKTGPRKLIMSLAEYLRREQKLGRVSERASADYAARTLLGACLSHAYLAAYLGPDPMSRSDDHIAREIVRCLLDGLNP